MLVMEFAGFRLDTINLCLWRRGNVGEDERTALTPKAFDVLRYLVEHAGRLVTQDEILSALWPQSYVNPEVLKRHVLEVRKALGDDPRNPRFIETMQRRGYRFIAPVSAGPETHRTAEAQPAHGRLVGRDTVLADLRDGLGKALRGRRQIVFVTGEPGIGKTALVDEFQRRASAEVAGLRFARGQCVEGYGGQEAYYPMLEALSQLCRGPGGDEIVNVLAEQAPTWLVQFPSLLQREHRQTLQREIAGATRERMLREIGDAVETIAAERPLLVVFEDLHWVDHATVDLLSALARRQSPARMMLIGSYRPVDLVDHPLKALNLDLLVHQLCQEIALKPVSEGDVADFLAGESARAGQSSGLANRVHRHSGGNPLFMVAMLDHMRSRGFITCVAGVWQLGVPLDEIEPGVPESLRTLIETQIERLSVEEQGALEVASVTGAAFAASVSAAATKLDPGDFEDLCDRLSRRQQLVHPVGSQQFPNGSTSARYEFVHALYREVMYGRLAFGRRARLHARIGERLQSLYGDALGEIASELAHHFEKGLDWARAVNYLQLAADTAGRRYALREATAILRHALELTPKLADAPRLASETEILKRLTAIYTATGYDSSALESHEALLARLAPHGLSHEHLRALEEMAFFVAWISAERCLEVVERVKRLGSGQADPGLRAQTSIMYFIWHILAGGWNSQYAEECRSALAEIRNLGDRSLVATGQILYSAIQWVSSAYREADRGASEGREILFERREEGAYLFSPYWMSRAVSSLSLSLLGEWGKALDEGEATMAMLAKHADEHRGHKLSQLYRAMVLLYAQDHAGVLEICDSVLPLVARDSGQIYPLRLCLILAGTADVALGNYERALEHLSAARDEMNRQAVALDWYRRMQLESGLAELWIAKQDLSLARPQAQRFLDATLSTEERTWQALAWETSARVALMESGKKRAAECIAKALSAIQGFEAPLAAWRVHATPAALYDGEKNRELADHHRDLSRATILSLADSLPQDSSLRKTFLFSRIVAPIIG
jgi:DNA-binding winged helix-turn-helix (wHTH) protein